MPITWTYENFNTFDPNENSRLLKKLESALPEFVNKSNDPNQPVLSLPSTDEDLAEIQSHSDRIASNCKEVLVIGVGGSSLGSQALIQACNKVIENRPKIHFADNLCPTNFPQLLASLDPKHTHILAISKSGNTLEVLVQLSIILEWLDKSKCKYNEHLTAITGNQKSPLSELITKHNIPWLEHINLLGGRFSILSNVGMLPAAIAGIKVDEVRGGAQDVINSMKNASNSAKVQSAIGAAHLVSQLYKKSINVSVLFLYSEKLRKFGEWYCQLWAESLGKNGVGTTPIVANGPLDQHSQLQLYMEGPRDKSYSFITVGSDADTKVTIPNKIDMLKNVGISGLTMNDIVNAMSEGTLHAISETGQPVRHLHIKKLDERTIGQLFMHFFLETKFASALLNVNPYGQPGVERGKVITREFLKKMNN